MMGHQKRHWRRDPKAKAVEAIHQFAGEARAQLRPQMINQIARAVLAREQVGDPPRSEDGTDTIRSKGPIWSIGQCSPGQRSRVIRSRQQVIADAERELC